MYFDGQTWMGWAPAKLNLFFEILNKREDGYHNVFSVCCPITLYDTLYFLPKFGGNIEFSLKCCFSDRKTTDNTNIDTLFSADAQNLVVDALELVRKTCHVQQAAQVKLLKRIPLQAGLGGGSSDAATAIMLANRAWNLGLSRDEMMGLGAKIGSDVPLFFIPGASFGTGRGESVTPVQTSFVFDIVVLKPPQGIATKDAFGHLVSMTRKTRNPEALIQGLKQGNRRQVFREMFNRFESVAFELHPKLESIKDTFARLDCPAFQMSGSGTAFFGICRNRRHASYVAGRLRSLHEGDVFQTHSISLLRRSRN